MKSEPAAASRGDVVAQAAPEPAGASAETGAPSGRPSPLSDEERRVIEDKGTERPFTGKYWNHHEEGTYTCRRCGAPLFPSSAKFDSGTGWPSFDEALPGAIKEIPDRDGLRTEIVCARCGAHLGHVFRGEGFTDKSTRNCVNSLALGFVPPSSASNLPATTAPSPSGGEATSPAAARHALAFFAGGCFWGVEYYLEQEPGVYAVTSGYMGGSEANPTYEQVSRHLTHHVETVQVDYDPTKVSYAQLAKVFFEIHDPTQSDGQGPDIGPQYHSVVFVSSDAERSTIEGLIAQLRSKGLAVVTRVERAGQFWPAEAYHQDYYSRKGTTPYCHRRVKRFE